MGDDRELSCLLSAWALGLVSALEVGGAAERAGMGEGLWDALVRLAGLSDRERFLAEEYASLHEEKGEEGAAALWSAAARDAELMRALEGLSGGVMETLLEWKGRIPEVRGEPGGSTLLRAFGGSSSTMKDAGIPAEAPVELRRGERDRYAFGEELGRGGLGRVLDAVDLDFGREVAVKMMLPGQSASAVERFLRESRAAGRLPHPNIIPVYEMGYLKDEAGAAPYFTMARIQGRDLREILTSLARGDEEAHASFNRPRLLRIFEEVCHAVSFAHDHGVLHRDLKPANVMVGDYGEVFVVDWGLAKFLDPPPASSGGAPGPCSEPLADGEQAEEGGESTGGPEGGGGGRSEEPLLTVDGQIMGTPAYMPPEQAQGRVEEVDALSDVYSLGAILFEILTYRPPFEGGTARGVLDRVLSEETQPPSRRVSELRALLEDGQVPGEGPGATAARSSGGCAPPPVPADLDAICLRAMAREKSRRYDSARALAEAVREHLEGEKERERNRAAADERVALGRKRVAAWRGLRGEREEAEAESARLWKQLRHFWPEEKKRPYWKVQARLAELVEEIARSFGGAEAAFQEALGFVQDHEDARAGLADLYWERYLLEEKQGDRSQTVYFEGLVRQYNDGQYDERLEGRGTLALRTQAYPCPCLVEGRPVSPQAFDPASAADPEAAAALAGAYHPFSGRALDGHSAGEGLSDLEPVEPLRLRVHGFECRPEPLKGADAWLFRYDAVDLKLLPRFPEGVLARGARRASPPASVVDNAFEPSSPYRPREGLWLGRTPVEGVSLPMGSYLVLLHRHGYRAVRYCLHVGRLDRHDAAVTLYRPEEVPAEYVQVPAGSFVYQGDKDALYTMDRQVRHLPDFFLRRYHVSCAEYRDYLEELAGEDEAAAQAAAPRMASREGHYWPRDEAGRWHVPTDAWRSRADPALAAQASKPDKTPFWWREDWPVLGISWKDAVRYVRHRTRKTGWLLGLPHELQWEKAARGTDGRPFSWGYEFDALLCNCSQSHDGPMRPVSLGGFPSDESPYGSRHHLGNVRDYMINDPGPHHPGWCNTRGGYWSTYGMLVRITPRTGLVKTDVDPDTSFRPVLFPSLSSLGIGCAVF